MNWLNIGKAASYLTPNTIKQAISTAASKLEEITQADTTDPNFQIEESIRRSEREGKTELDVLGITPQLEEFVCNLSPQTFKNFPLEGLNLNKALNAKQIRHAKLILKRVPELNQLRYNLCPGHMRDETFWLVYFLLIRNKTGEVDLDDNSYDIQFPPTPRVSVSEFSKVHSTGDLQSMNNNFYTNNNIPTNNSESNNNANSTSPLLSKKGFTQFLSYTGSMLTTPRRKNSMNVGVSEDGNVVSFASIEEFEDYFANIWSPQILILSNTSSSAEELDPKVDNYFSPVKVPIVEDSSSESVNNSEHSPHHNEGDYKPYPRTP
eukprot:TRINITY_DN3282_c0_g1_i2.p1 TRINITY_DN3282_c0_g1~~TRINITY_DN3282_c0_g1_i2.p1  ORF type:complete len:321 (-),score=71.60 TRINITY_DN3282_c0_g1_i2:101-1063(-)